MCIIIHRFETNEETTIEDCESLIRRFVENNLSIIYYDSLPVTSHFQLPNDALVLTAMSPRNLSQTALQELWNRRNDINGSLQVINTNLHLVDNPFPQDAIRNILRIFLNINGIRIAIASKILHKERPKLFPIIDKKVMDIYGFPAGKGKYLEEVIKWIKHMGKDIEGNRNRLGELKNIAEEIARNVYQELNISFSLVRIFDIILWQHQQENEP